MSVISIGILLIVFLLGIVHRAAENKGAASVKWTILALIAPIIVFVIVNNTELSIVWQVISPLAAWLVVLLLVLFVARPNVSQISTSTAWQCPGCGRENTMFDQRCPECGTAKPEDTVLTGEN